VPDPLRVAYTLEHCWHPVPGGSAVAANSVASRLARRPDIEVVGVAGRHRRPPAPGYAPPIAVRSLPIARPWLYEAWNRVGWPPVERVTGRIDVCHSAVAIPAPSEAPSVVTVHDVAFMVAPERFTRHGARVMRAGLERCRRADLVLCPSLATIGDLVALGFDDDRLRHVPWGVEARPVSADVLAGVVARYALPERFVLFVGTVEPRKNLARLAAAVGLVDRRLPLVVAGAAGWGDVEAGGEVRFLGFVPDADLAALYRAATVFAYPSLQEGFGLPVVEAMAYGVPVVTSAGSATEEVAGGAAVLVDPAREQSIADGIDAALAEAETWSQRGLARAATFSWDLTVERTVAAYREAAGR
jgi:glycosyltransferase involved in cell wall biosynthesis